MESQICTTTSLVGPNLNNQPTQRLVDMESCRQQQANHLTALLLGNWQWIDCSVLARLMGLETLTLLPQLQQIRDETPNYQAYKVCDYWKETYQSTSNWREWIPQRLMYRNTQEINTQDVMEELAKRKIQKSRNQDIL